jgi:hypothetical protein
MAAALSLVRNSGELLLRKRSVQSGRAGDKLDTAREMREDRESMPPPGAPNQPAKIGSNIKLEYKV